MLFEPPNYTAFNLKAVLFIAVIPACFKRESSLCLRNNVWMPDRRHSGMTITELRFLSVFNIAVKFKQGLNKADFLEDPKTQSAVLNQLMVMGEAVKRLSQAYRAEHPEIPWRAMAGMRDVLIHGYDIVNLNQVWKTVAVDIPQILPLLETLSE
jgi:uncharacterized protein with HEPN domain